MDLPAALTPLPVTVAGYRFYTWFVAVTFAVPITVRRCPYH